jgi:polar amino acid transport system ATP-binding protein
MKGLSEQGYTMIVVTHEMAFAEKVADKIIFMENGKIVEVNTPERFFICPNTLEARRFLNINQDYVL